MVCQYCEFLEGFERENNVMKSKEIEEKECPLCKNIYEYTVYYDDGEDWEGHHRASSSSYVVDKCPFCGGDVRTAAKILDEKEGKEKERLELLKKDCKDKIPIEVIYNSFKKNYIYYSLKPIKDGLYSFNKDGKIILCLARVVPPEEKQEYTLEQLNILNGAKLFNANYIGDNIYSNYKNILIQKVEDKKFEDAQSYLYKLSLISNKKFLDLLDCNNNEN